MNGNISISVRLLADWMSSAALEVEAASTCWSLVELPHHGFWQSPQTRRHTACHHTDDPIM